MPNQRAESTMNVGRARRLATPLRWPRRARQVALCCMMALVVSAWISSASQAASSTVKIGFFVNLTGTDSQYPDGLAGAKAAVRGINARGGINGHKVVLDYCDVQSSVNVAEQCARGFVSSHVAAVVGDNTNYGPQQNAILQAAHIPNIADSGLTAAAQYTSPVEFPIASGFVGQFASGVYYGLKVAKPALKSFAFVGLQIPVVASLEGSVESQVKREGGSWKGFISMPASTTSFAPYVQAAISSGAKVVYLGMSGQQVSEFALAAEAAGAKFHTFVVAIAYTPQTIATLGPNTSFGKNILFGADIPPASATAQYPVLKNFVTDMVAEQKAGDKYAAPTYRSTAQEEVWYAFHAADVIMQMIPGTITSASVLHQLQVAKNVNLGLQPPWTPSAKGPKGYSRVSTWNEYMFKLVNGKLALASPKPFNVESFVAG